LSQPNSTSTQVGSDKVLSRKTSPYWTQDESVALVVDGGDVVPGEGIYLVKVNKHVIICLDNKLCLFTEVRDPELAHDVLVREVSIVVTKHAQDCVMMLIIFLLNVLLCFLLIWFSQQKHKLGHHAGNARSTPGSSEETSVPNEQ
jgi:hypothetical protein